MTTRHPPIEPYEHGLLDVGTGHQVYWECSGNPAGKPAIFLHGGPGTGCGNGARRYFDPSVYRIVLFDQRGSGRSFPLASEPNTDLRTNTTAHLIADIELLRAFLGVDQWTMLGISWGTTLALAYAQTHPTRVRALVLALVCVTSAQEVKWMTRDLGRVFPREYEQFVALIPESMRHLRSVDAYATMLFDADPDRCARAASAWCDWDNAQMSRGTGATDPRFRDPAFRLRFARLVTHYWRNGAFMDDDQLLRDAKLLNGIPGVMIHGRNDISCALATPWQLAKVWTTSELRIIESGHGNDTTFPVAVTQALDEFAR